MKECMRGTGGSSGNFEGKPDDGSGASGLNIPGRCVGCPYLEGVTREHAADVGLRETEAAQREIDEVTADCPGAAIATAADQNAGFRGCNSPVLGEGKRTGRYVSFDRYSPDLAIEQARQAVLALRESLLPDNYDGSEEEYATPPHRIEEIRGAGDDKS